MTLYLTFDIGTTALKTALITNDGRVLAIHTAEYTHESPRADWAEMRPDAYWKALVEGTKAVFAQTTAEPSELAAIGFSSQGQTFIPIDSAGQSLYNAIVWVDNRAQEIADEWEASWLSKDDFRRISGYPWIPACLTVFKIAWLAQNSPEAHRAWKFLCLPDYLIYRLTGETVTDRVIAQMSGLYDLRTGTWEPRLLAAAGITEAQLPTVQEPGTVAGHVRPAVAAELGIPSGVAVCVGANDQLVGAIGAGNVRHGIVTETTGTSLALIATTEQFLDDSRICVGHHAVGGLHYGLSFANTSAIVLKWFRDLCAPGQNYDVFLSDMENIPPGCEGLAVLPHFAGTSTCPDARGAFVGLTLGHTRAHIARAIMEACACMLQECMEPVCERVDISSVRSLGGAARSDSWLQMKADLLGVPVERPACSDAASLGAAMLAATGIGRFNAIEEAAHAWYRPEHVFEPNTSRFQAYQEVYARYKSLCKRLYG